MSLPKESESWFAIIRDIAITYNVDLILEAQSPRGKLAWKNYIKSTVLHNEKFKLLSEATKKSSLKHIFLEDLTRNHHQIRFKLPTSTHIREDMQFRANMLSGTYILELNRYKFGLSDSDICKCCESVPETMTHFLLECPGHSNVRSIYLPRIDEETDLHRLDDTHKCKIILNGYEHLQNINIILQKHCSLFCLAIHKSRNDILKINENDYVDPDCIKLEGNMKFL